MHAQVNGTQMAYTDEGAGRTLLLVHGFPLNRQVWAPQIAAFRRDHRVIAPDLRGLGESRGTADPVAMDRYAEDLQALITHLNAGPVILTGHSMGGYVALAFARAFPETLAGLVLVATKAGADTAEAAAARRASAEQVRAEGSPVVVDAMAARMLSSGNTDPAMAAEVRGFMASSGPEGIIAALLGMAGRPDAGAWLEQIRVPTLVVAGADDALMPLAAAEALARGIPGAQLEVIPKAGHLVAFEQAEAFNAALGTWLSQRVP